MSDLFDRFVEFSAQFILLDWGALIGLIPIGLAVAVVLWLIFTIRKFANAGPKRRGKGRITPHPPPGIHLPGPSYAPILGGIGTAVFLLGLVFGGALLVAGVIILVLSLLYWGSEALSDYDRAVRTERALVVVEHREPPPGVHLPGPSFRPILASLALTILFFGLVFGGWILAVGILATIVTLLGWLRDARREYTNVVAADRTGHLENLGVPNWPRRLVTVFAILVIGALVVDLGIVPPRSDSAVGGGGPGGSAEPGGPDGPGTSAPPPPEGDVVLIAKDSKFDKAELPVPAGEAFTIGFVNEDGGIQHDVALVGDSGLLFDGENITGTASITYDVPALDAGSYQFLCTIHPTMTGTLTAGG
jgi:plastocyanin